MSDRYIPIDEEGYFVFDGRRVDDEDLGRRLLENIVPAGQGFATSMDGQPAMIEAFDAPLIARHVQLDRETGFGRMDLPYHTTQRFALNALSVDEWDRFHGVNEKGVPMVLARSAQIELFDLLDEFDDDSITVKGQRFAVPTWLGSRREANDHSFWSEMYRAPTSPPFDLHRESPILPAIAPQLKLSRRRILVLGCGPGHDAAFFANQGHMVTAVDFSEVAVDAAQAKYGHLENLKFMQADAFRLPESMNGQFDLVFEHTFFAAVSPERRNELVKTWLRVLAPQGELLGVFFANEKHGGPPFGSSEWELRERLKSHFNFLFWTRWRNSVEARKGNELVVFARRR